MEDCESRVLGFTTNEKHTLEAENKTRKQELLHFPARSLKYDRETNKSQKDWSFWIMKLMRLNSSNWLQNFEKGMRKIGETKNIQIKFKQRIWRDSQRVL